MSFGVDGSDVAPTESCTEGWQTTQRLSLFEAVRLGFKETFRSPGFEGGSDVLEEE